MNLAFFKLFPCLRRKQRSKMTAEKQLRDIWVSHKMARIWWKKSLFSVCVLYLVGSLQSAVVCILHLVCIWYPVCGLHFLLTGPESQFTQFFQYFIWKLCQNVVFQEFPFPHFLGQNNVWWFEKMITRPQKRQQVDPAPHLTCSNITTMNL